MRGKYIFILFLAITILFSSCSARRDNNIFDAIKDGNITDVKSITKNNRSSLKETDSNLNSALHIAAENQNPDIVNYLLDQGADVNHKNLWGENPIYSSIRMNNIEIIKTLIKNGGNVNAKNNHGESPLHIAVSIGNIEVIDYLIAQGADPNAKDSVKSTPLRDAVARGKLDVVKYLISKGADPNIISWNGDTLLHSAVSSGNLETVKFLVSRGFDIDAKNDFGKTALDLSLNLQKKDIIYYLISQKQLAPYGQKSKKDSEKAKLMGSKSTSNNVESKEPDPPNLSYNIDFGQYFALVIGNNNYTHLPQLKTAQNDAKEVAEILKDQYGFKVNLIMDAKRSDILLALNNLRWNLTNHDNLLIYYAGHGWLDKEADEGYWLPVDAQKNNMIAWVSNSSITASLRALKAKHVLIVADSCYSGKLARGVHIVDKSPGYLSRLSRKRARCVISSGGLEPVADSGGDGLHSVFATAFLNALKENNDILDGADLFNKLRRPVMLNSDQTPEYSDIRKAGHEGGEFLFIRKK
jgi:ankyrin repeat protein/uncharacterized caspase-like protein